MLKEDIGPKINYVNSIPVYDKLILIFEIKVNLSQCYPK